MSRVTLFVALLLGLLASIVPQGLARAASETVIVPFTSGDIGVQTQNTYSGNVTITVSGFGQAAGTSLSDAFYRFAEDGGSTPIVPELTSFGLLINGQLAADYLPSPPAYRSDHTYIFTIHAPGARLRFSLAVGDAFVADNSGEFVVTLTGGGQSGGAPNPGGAPAGYISQPSYPAGQGCPNPPPEGICLGFDDGYIWSIPGFTFGCDWDWDENAGTWAGHTIQVVTDCDGSIFKHIMGTDYVSYGEPSDSAPGAVLGATAKQVDNATIKTFSAQLSCAAGVSSLFGLPKLEFTELALAVLEMNATDDLTQRIQIVLNVIIGISNPALGLFVGCVAPFVITISNINAMYTCMLDVECAKWLENRTGYKRVQA